MGGANSCKECIEGDNYVDGANMLEELKGQDKYELPYKYEKGQLVPAHPHSRHDSTRVHHTSAEAQARPGHHPDLALGRATIEPVFDPREELILEGNLGREVNVDPRQLELSISAIFADDHPAEFSKDNPFSEQKLRSQDRALAVYHHEQQGFTGQPQTYSHNQVYLTPQDFPSTKQQAGRGRLGGSGQENHYFPQYMPAYVNNQPKGATYQRVANLIQNN